MGWFRRGLLLAEFTICLATVAIFGSAYPDRYRTRLWENGGAEGWNSDPDGGFKVPLIWSQQLTDANLAKAILSATVFLVRTATARFSNPLGHINAVYSAFLCLLWIASVRDQMSSDYSDADHPSARPWYLTRSCSEARDQTRFACVAAKSSLFIASTAVLFYGLDTLVEILQGMSVRMKEGPRSKVEDGERWTGTGRPFINEQRSNTSDGYDYDSHDEMQTTRDRNRTYDSIYEPWSPVLAFYPADTR